MRIINKPVLDISYSKIFENIINIYFFFTFRILSDLKTEKINDDKCNASTSLGSLFYPKGNLVEYFGLTDQFLRPLQLTR